MQLTPIKIRGRYKRRAVDPTNASKKPKPDPNRRPGRPLLSSQAILASSQSRINRRERLCTPKAVSVERNKLSILEGLPVELIERIFLYSLNVSLPRASLVLNAAVSSERVYRVLVLLAFWEDSSVDGVGDAGGREDGENAIANILRPMDYAPLTDDERGNLQRMVVRCKWFSVNRLLRLLPDLMNLVVQRQWVCAGVEMEEEQESALDRFLGMEEDVRVFEGVGKDNQRWTLSVEPLVSVTVSNEETGRRTTQSVLGVKEFPGKLLRGENGFSEEDSIFLETLRIASGFNRSENLDANNITLPREALQGGIRAALVAHNTRVLTTLLKIDEYFIRSLNANVADSLQYTLPAEHFSTAVRVSPNDPTLFQLLVRASAESVPGDDSEITQWAMDLGNPLGDWLLELMVRLPQLQEAARENPAEGGVFYMGRANGQTEMGRRYLDEVLNVAELGSWMGETSFDVSSLWKVAES